MHLLVNSSNMVQRYSIDNLLTIGRGDNNTIPLADSEVSRNHCKIERIGAEGFVVIDLDSTNGTRVNGVAVKQQKLKSGDTLQVGASLLVLVKTKTDESPSFMATITKSNSQVDYELPVEEAEERVREIIIQLFQMNQTDNAGCPLDLLLETVLNGILSITSFERGMVLLPDSSGQFRYLLGRDRKRRSIPKGKRYFSRTILNETLSKKNLVNFVQCGDLLSMSKSLKQLRARCTVCLPMIPPAYYQTSKGEADIVKKMGDFIPGVFYLDSRLTEPKINEEIQLLIQALSIHAAVALENIQLQQKATTDGLTGALNRTAFDRVLQQLHEQATTEELSFAVIFIDLDHFKRINDEYGHPIGDEVLREVSDRIRKVIHEADSFGRYGGEEFILALPGISAASALSRGEEIRNAICATTMTRHQLQVTASLGMALYPEHASKNIETLVARADQALYSAKHNGRNRFVLWNTQFSKILDASSDNEEPQYHNEEAQYHTVFANCLELFDALRLKTPSQELLTWCFEKATEILGVQQVVLFTGTKAQEHIVVSKASFTESSTESLENDWQLAVATISQQAPLLGKAPQAPAVQEKSTAGDSEIPLSRFAFPLIVEERDFGAVLFKVLGPSFPYQAILKVLAGQIAMLLERQLRHQKNLE
jgi:diguanylate cyclase (GGDEF)-like protein